MILKTKRLILRPWIKEDLIPFAKLNADPRVMKYFPSTLSQKESHDFAKRISTKLQKDGWGLWAVSAPGIADFIGFIGLSKPSSKDKMDSPPELNWRLAYEYWGQGYATEGASATLQYAFQELKLNEITSFTADNNLKSRSVMERLGMHLNHAMDKNRPDGSIHYRITLQEWQKHPKLKLQSL